MKPILAWVLPVLALVLGIAATPVVAAAQTLSVQGVLMALVWLVIVGLIFYAIWWFIGWIGLPEPFNKIARVLVGLVALILIINFLLSFLGSGPFLKFG